MDGRTLCFVLLLPLTVCDGSEVTLVKTVSCEPDVTPLCTNETMKIVSLVVCKISTEGNREQCSLIYSYGKGFEHGCGSRFRLITENQTVFLHLSSLTAEDSGSYTCQCSQLDGTFILHLNVTVEVSEGCINSTDTSKSTVTRKIIICGLAGVTFIIIGSGVILGFIHRKLSHRINRRRLNTELKDIEPYSTFTRKESGLYSTVKIQPPNS